MPVCKQSGRPGCHGDHAWQEGWHLAWAVALSVLSFTAHAGVVIDQSPLTVQQPLPPNLVLMLDDSGSMAWDFMPDWSFLSDNQSYADPPGAVAQGSGGYGGYGGDYGGSGEFVPGAMDASVNGTYYNPGVDYAPPPEVNGTLYPASGTSTSNPMGTAWLNGFQPSLGAVDITQYTSPGDGGGDNSTYPYYQELGATVPLSYPSVPGCMGGRSLVPSGNTGAGQCGYEQQQEINEYPASRQEIRHGQCNTSGYVLQREYGGHRRSQWYCVQYQATYSGPYSAPVPGCNPGGTLSSDGSTCTGTTTTAAYLFLYTTSNPNAAPGAYPYINHYVGRTQQDCTIATTADTNPGTTCVYDLATQQNVANWFSYYRTRILMAKSGLMMAFSNLPATTRFGFGSINGNALSSVPSPTYGFNDSAGNQTGLSNNVLAEVEPFGDGSNGTQKAAFWQWLLAESPDGGTPLRKALQAVGQYYGSAQPWQNSDTDTTQLACRQSYTLLTTDGFWNGGTPNVGNADGTSGPAQVSANGEHYRYQPAAPFSDDISNTLADVAMKYWETDLQPNLANEVPTDSADPAFWQHMVTFTMGLGFVPLTCDVGSAPIPMDQVATWANGGPAIPGFSWPAPSANGENGTCNAGTTDGGSGNGSGGIIENTADLAHAGIDGHGGFFSAKNPVAFADGIEQALQRVQQRVGTGASLAANSTKLDTGTVTYQAVYWSGAWKGDLKAFPVNSNTGAIATTANWSAQTALPAWNARNVWTYNPASASSSYFQFDAANVDKLSPAQKAALDTAATPAASTSTSNPMPIPVINYLLGDTSNAVDPNALNPTGVYRYRDTPLGDIVDSQPVYEGAPNPNLFGNQNFTGASTYPQFATDEANRAAVIWIAGNDGMLHAFSASTGAEVFAYLPGAVITANSAGAVETGIANLADPNYGSSNPHEYFNDGQLTIADAYLNGTWASILVGTTGRGPAKAIYAFNVTNPASPTFLWERSASDGQSDSNYIGQITSAPVIAQTGNGSWSVLVGNGYNSSANQAALLQFNLATGALTVYTAGSATNNGLSAPTVQVADAASGVATTAYAGDLNGDVWAFDLTQPASTGNVVFTATDASGNPQPITAGVLTGIDPENDVWIFFGTGKYLTQDDLSNIGVQTWYGVIVKSASAAHPAVASCSATAVANKSCTPGSRGQLLQRTIVAEQAPNSNENPPDLGGRVISPATTGDMNGKSGWYIDLVSPTLGAQGERMVLPNQFQGSLLLGTTRIPVSSDPCNPSGSGWIMAINPFTGSNPETPFFDLNNDGQFNAADEIEYDGKLYAAAGIGFTSVPNAPIFVGNTMLTSFDNASTSSLHTAGSAGILQRTSWRELINP